MDPSIENHKCGFRHISYFSGALTLAASMLVFFLFPLHIYHAKSGYSGHKFWIAFPIEPTERDFYDHVLANEPDLKSELSKDAIDRFLDGKKEKGLTSGLRIGPFGTGELIESPLQGGKFPKGWLTEPSTRFKVPTVAVFATVAALLFLLMFCMSVCCRWGWYFLLNRLAEIGKALKGIPTGGMD